MNAVTTMLVLMGVTAGFFEWFAIALWRDGYPLLALVPGGVLSVFVGVLLSVATGRIS